MNKNTLVSYVNLLFYINDKIQQLKDKYKPYLKISNSIFQFELYDKIVNNNYSDYIYFDFQNQLCYKGMVLNQSTSKDQLFIAFDILHKKFIFINGSEIEKNCLIDDDSELIPKLLQNSYKTILIDSYYFNMRIQDLLSLSHFITDNIDILTEMYETYKNDIFKQLTDKRIVLNCLREMDLNSETITNNNFDNNYVPLLECYMSYYVDHDIVNRLYSTIKKDIGNTYIEISQFINKISSQDYIQFIDYKNTDINNKEITPFIVVKHYIHFTEFLDIILFSEFVDSLQNI